MQVDDGTVLGYHSLAMAGVARGIRRVLMRQEICHITGDGDLPSVSY